MIEHRRLDTYLLVNAGGRPRLAIPLGTRAQRVAAVRRIQPTSWKRKLFRHVVMLGAWSNLDRRLLKVVKPPLPDTCGFSLVSWLCHVREVLGRADLCAAVVWPPQADRGRIYVHLLSAEGVPTAFVKVSFDQANDALLEREAEALTRVAELQLRSLRTPRVLELGEWVGRRYLMTEAVGQGAAPVHMDLEDFPQPWLREYAGEVRELDKSELDNLDWWRSFRACSPETPSFAAAVFEALAHGVKVCRVHGDYGGNNMLTYRGQLWLLDWEHSHEHGPCRADEIRLWLGLNQAAIANDPAGAVVRFQRRFMDGVPPEAAAAAIMALAFLHVMGIASARLLAEKWPADKSSNNPSQPNARAQQASSQST